MSGWHSSLFVCCAVCCQALWLVEHQRWEESANALRLAHQLNYCQLPVSINQDDLQKYRSKQVGMIGMDDQRDRRWMALICALYLVDVFG